MELPEQLQTKLTRFGAAVWEAAMAEAVAKVQDERSGADALIRASDELLTETLIAAEGARKEAADLRTRDAALEAEAETIRKRLHDVRDRFDHVRSEEFWDRVMQEVYEVLPGAGNMHCSEIMTRLRRATLRGGRLIKEPLDETNLCKKMDVRAGWSRYFRRIDDGVYSRLADWDGRTGMLRPGKVA